MYNIYVQQKNYDLKYTLEQPIVANNVTVYQFLLLKSSIKEWEDNITGTIFRSACFQNGSGGNSYEMVLNDGGTEYPDYYKCLVPYNVLSRRGKLYFTVQVSNMDNSVIYRTHVLTVPPDIYEAGQMTTTISIGDGSTLSTILQALVGGEENEALVKNSSDNYDYKWTKDIYASQAEKLGTARRIGIGGLAEGSGSFDGSQDITIPITKINFSASGAQVAGKLPVDCLPDSVLGQMVYGGSINGATGIITLSAGAKDRLKLTASTYDTSKGVLSNAEGIYFICSTTGAKPIALEVGDWLLINNNSWSRIDNTDAVSSVRGSNNTAAQAKTGAVVLDADDVSAAKADITATKDATKGYPAYRAEELYSPRAINGINFNATSDITNYCRCITASDTAAKTATLSTFKLQTGSTLYISFDSTNTANSVTLNVNGTGAKPIYARGYQVGSANLGADTIRTGYIYLMVYDGANYVIATGIDSAPTQISSVRESSTLAANATSAPVPKAIYDVGGYGSKMLVYLDGKLLQPATDYTVDTATKTINNLPAAGQERKLDFFLYVSEAVVVPTEIRELTDTTNDVPVNKATLALSANKLAKSASIMLASGDYTGNAMGFDGSSSLVLPLPDTLDADVIGDVTGNADTATKLKTSRKIGNADFDGSADITLDAIGGTSKAKTGTLAVASWSSNSQSLAVEGITASNNIIVSPTTASATNWNLFGVSCSAQATNSLTFTCKTTPTAAIDVQVIILP